LVVRQWEDSSNDAKYFDTVLTPSEGSLTIPCKKVHRFFSAGGCRAVEVYVSAIPDLDVSNEDIVRLDTGGIS
jgi:hypothetical protein